MEKRIDGLHHVTAIAGDPQQNVDFYTGVLGLRLVKQTVNFDDPNSYHFYYGNESGDPGTIMTFFSWPGARKGSLGTGQATATAFSVPIDALEYWKERLSGFDVDVLSLPMRFGEQTLAFSDPDGLALELVAVEGDDRSAWSQGSVPSEYAIRGFHGVTLSERSEGPTASLLTEELGFRLAAREGDRARYEVGTGGSGTIVDIVTQPDIPYGVVASGTVHHIAFRTPDDAAQETFLRDLLDHRIATSSVQPRLYFNSIYFREPGRVLFEIATDGPGMTIDEPLAELGHNLRLPSWYEPNRAEIAKALPAIRVG